MKTWDPSEQDREHSLLYRTQVKVPLVGFRARIPLEAKEH